MQQYLQMHCFHITQNHKTEAPYCESNQKHLKKLGIPDVDERLSISCATCTPYLDCKKCSLKNEHCVAWEQHYAFVKWDSFTV